MTSSRASGITAWWGVAGGSVSATFLYHADACPERSQRGNRVKGIVAGVTTVYPSTWRRAGLAGLSCAKLADGAPTVPIARASGC